MAKADGTASGQAMDDVKVRKPKRGGTGQPMTAPSDQAAAPRPVEGGEPGPDTDMSVAGEEDPGAALDLGSSATATPSCPAAAGQGVPARGRFGQGGGR